MIAIVPKRQGEGKYPPPGNKKEISENNLQESSKPGVKRFGAKNGNALISNKHFNTPRGEQDLKFKR